MVVGINNEQPVIFEASIDEALVSNLKGNNENRKLIYLAPLTFGYLTSEEKGVQIYSNARSNKDIKVNIEKMEIKKNKNKDISKKKNKENWETITDVISKLPDSEKNQHVTGTTSAAATVYEVYNEPSFCKISLGGSAYSYGGNQSWFEDPYSKEISCGVVAAASITAYWAKNSTSYAKLYPYSDLTSSSFNKTNFTTHMKKLYDNIKPNGTIGVPSLSYFNSGLEKYQNTTTSSKLTKTNISTGTYANFVNSITTGLSNKAPIVILTYLEQFNFPYPNSFNFHWITITKYYKDNNTQIEYFACSSWGTRYSLYLDDYYLAYDSIEGAYYK